MTTFTVDPGSSTPPFEQLRAQIAEQIESGRLSAGSRLPPVRRLAEQLGLAANTVARTYRELEGVGLVVTGGRNGTTVAPGRVQKTDPAASRITAEYLAAMAASGYDGEAAIGLVRRAVDQARR